MSRFTRALPLLCLPLLAGLPARADVQWKTFDKALKEAAAETKYGFVDVYTDWCGYCRMLENTTLKSKQVTAELAKNFVSIKMNAESEETVVWKGRKISKRELAAQWGVEGFPTLLFLSSKGEIIGSYPSYVEADLLLKLLTYISSGARERKLSFQDYLKEAS